jgi:glycosyltransferase involved in cell wall biosynthesis
MRRLSFERATLWTYNPLTTRLLDCSPFERIVYHCVDDIAAQPGMPAGTLERAESELARGADIVFATSPKLAETRREWNPETHFLPNVADFAHFSRALEPDLAVPDDIARLRGPRIGFIGAISGYKLDFALIRRTALELPDCSIVLIGQVGEGDPWTDAAILGGLPNVHLLGPRPYDLLPAYLKGMDVAMLPNAINAYTESMFPMKFFEYLAAGRPVVSVDLPALRPFADVVSLAGSAESFAAAIRAALDGQIAPLDDRLALARAHTYDARTDRMLELLDRSEAAAAPGARRRPQGGLAA